MNRMLVDTVARINIVLKAEGYIELVLRSGYGKVGVDRADTNHNLTHLCTTRELLVWLEGFEAALNFVMMTV